RYRGFAEHRRRHGCVACGRDPPHACHRQRRDVGGMGAGHGRTHLGDLGCTAAAEDVGAVGRGPLGWRGGVMAQTLASGVVIPDPGDRISAAGVQEMRTLGASVDSGLSLAQAQVAQVDAQSRARDADLADQVAGMEGMTYVGACESGTSYRINDVVTHAWDSWARLTAGDAGEPGTSPTDWGLVARKGDGGGFGQLTETEVVGLYDTVEPPPWSPPDPIDLGTAHLDTITEPGDYTQIFA